MVAAVLVVVVVSPLPVVVSSGVEVVRISVVVSVVVATTNVKFVS